jgi:hypothetical protein
VTVTVTGRLAGSTDAGENMHCAPVGRPKQLNVIGVDRVPADPSVNCSVPAPPEEIGAVNGVDDEPVPVPVSIVIAGAVTSWLTAAEVLPK